MKNLKKNFNLEKELIKKHRHGQKKYHAFSFLEDSRDMNLEAADELIDAINYQVYKSIKQKYSEEELKTWSVAKLNKTYIAIVKDLSAFSRRTVIGHLEIGRAHV